MGATKRNMIIGFVLAGLGLVAGLPMAIFGKPPVTDECPSAGFKDINATGCKGHITGDEGLNAALDRDQGRRLRRQRVTPQPNVKYPIWPRLTLTCATGAKVGQGEGPGQGRERELRLSTSRRAPTTSTSATTSMATLAPFKEGGGLSFWIDVQNAPAGSIAAPSASRRWQAQRRRRCSRRSPRTKPVAPGPEAVPPSRTEDFRVAWRNPGATRDGRRSGRRVSPGLLAGGLSCACGAATRPGASALASVSLLRGRDGRVAARRKALLADDDADPSSRCRRRRRRRRCRWRELRRIRHRFVGWLPHRHHAHARRGARAVATGPALAKPHTAPPERVGDLRARRAHVREVEGAGAGRAGRRDERRVTPGGEWQRETCGTASRGSRALHGPSLPGSRTATEARPGSRGRSARGRS